MNPNIRSPSTIVYEVLYSKGQLQIEPAFTPFETSNELAGWREFAILLEVYDRGLHRHAGRTGLFSPKFFLKSGISGDTFIKFADTRVQADVVLINAQPQNALMSYNVWQNGEACHPGLMRRSQALLDKVGIGWNLAEQGRHGPDVLCYSNFWVANEAFWDSYVGEILSPIARYILDHPTAEVVRAVMEPTRHTTPSIFLPFMIERLFTTFLALHPIWRVAPLLLSPKERCLSPIESTIITFTAPMLEKAKDHLSAEIIEMLQFLQIVRREYHDVYFATRPHPHTGEVVSDYWHGQPHSKEPIS